MTMNAKVTAKVKEGIEGIACWNSARKGRCTVELPYTLWDHKEASL